MNVLNLAVNFPSYQNLKVGDVFVWFVGDESKETKDGDPLVHAHWYTVKYKDTRYAEIDIELIQCDNFGTQGCTEPQECQRYGWTKLQFYAHKTRWMTGPAALVLFGKRVYGNDKK